MDAYPFPHILTFKIMSFQSEKWIYIYHCFLFHFPHCYWCGESFYTISSVNGPSISFVHFSNWILLSYQFWKNSYIIIHLQDTLHQNMAPWHIEYIKLKKFEKHHIQEEFYTFPWNKSTIMWEMPSLYPEERSLLISEDEGMERNLNYCGLLYFPQYIIHLAHTFCPAYFSIIFHPSSNLIL